MKKLIYIIGISLVMAPSLIAMQSKQDELIYVTTRVSVCDFTCQNVPLCSFLPSHKALCLPFNPASRVALINVEKFNYTPLTMPFFHADCPGFQRNCYDRRGLSKPLYHNDDSFFTPTTVAYDNENRLLFLGKRGFEASCATLVAHRMGGSTAENATAEQSIVFQDGLYDSISDIALMPQNKLIGISRGAIIWDVETAAQTHTIKPEDKGFVEKVIALTPHTLLIAAKILEKSVIHLWDLRVNQSVQSFDSEIFTLILKSFTSEDTFLISNQGDEKILQQWDIKMGKP